MPFNILLLTCLTSKTGFTASGGRVSLHPLPGEIALFFSIDSPSKRKDLKIQGAISDYLVFYVKGDEKVLCLVESKGKDLDHAIEQVINTKIQLRNSLLDSLKRGSCESYLQMITWKAYIYQHGSTPTEKKQSTKRLKDTFGNKNYDISHNEDIGDFLRKSR